MPFPKSQEELTNRISTANQNIDNYFGKVGNIRDSYNPYQYKTSGNGSIRDNLRVSSNTYTSGLKDRLNELVGSKVLADTSYGRRSGVNNVNAVYSHEAPLNKIGTIRNDVNQSFVSPNIKDVRRSSLGGGISGAAFTPSAVTGFTDRLNSFIGQNNSNYQSVQPFQRQLDSGLKFQAGKQFRQSLSDNLNAYKTAYSEGVRDRGALYSNFSSQRTYSDLLNDLYSKYNIT